MTLQARLTLWSMLVMASIVTIVSLSDLIGEVNGQFLYALDRAKLIANIAADVINRHAVTSPKRRSAEAIANALALEPELRRLANTAGIVDEIAVTDESARILADTTADQAGKPFPKTPKLEDLVFGLRWWNKLEVLSRGRPGFEFTLAQLYQGGGAIAIHVIVLPALMRVAVAPILTHHAWIAILSVVGSVLGAFLFSTIAFRPLGKLGKMLDIVAGGDYELQQVSQKPDDEFGMVASKVSLLGQKLQGAQTEFSDLKGNFERLLDELEDAVLIFGRDRRLIAAAGAVEAFVGRPRLELVGLAVNEVFPPATSIGLLLAQAMQHARPVRNRAVPVTQEREGASHLKIVLLTVEFLGDRSGMLIRLRDPETTRQIGRQLQTADRLSAISQLTSGVAHEVKNPLNAILMHVELAKMKLVHGDEHDVGPHMEVLSSEILRLDRVVKTFLDFTRPVQLNLTDVPLAEFVNDVADLARPQAEAVGIEVEVENGAEPVSITIDPDLFKQALLNIVVNAIEAMPNGGRLRFWSGVRGTHAEIRISDTGPGIPAEVRDQIYNLYFTTKQKGSGIGLSMTFRIVQLHDARIDFDSEPNRGVTFSLRLPVAVLNA